MAKVLIPSLVNKQVSLPHTEQGSQAVYFRADGEAYGTQRKRNKKGEVVLDKEGQAVWEERALDQEEKDALVEHYALYGVVVTK